MGLRLHNTLTRTKQDFAPIDAANVRMYVCGPTVYDFAHIGNARPLIVFDVLFRLLRHIYKPEHVTYVRNITDVDDKINARAAEEYPHLPLNEAIRAVTEKTEKQFHEDVKALGCLPPTHEPRATEFIARNDVPEDMIRLIGKLIQKGNAYAAEGHVLFHVPSMPDYGKLSNRTLDDMIAGARVEVAPYKRDPMDFVLWKPSKPGEPAWPSPWGDGRPGWHIECSAMAGALLGDTFDIHGGGIDLIFPHHENEIAQSRCAHGTDVMANYWLHNGFLQVEGEKMSKSTGNFVTIRELLNDWAGDVVRLNMLKTHYRQPIDWTDESMTLATVELEEWASTLEGYFELAESAMPSEAIVAELADDLNSPAAINVLRQLHSAAKSGDLQVLKTFGASCKLLGFKNLNFPGYFQFGISGLNVDRGELFEHEDDITKYRAAIANNAPVGVTTDIADKVKEKDLIIEVGDDGYITLTRPLADFGPRVESLLAARAAARVSKDFAEADRIRKELDAMGIALKDAKDPKTGELVTTWEVKR